MTLPAPPKGRCSSSRLISIAFLAKIHTLKTSIIPADHQKQSAQMTKHFLPPPNCNFYAHVITISGAVCKFVGSLPSQAEGRCASQRPKSLSLGKWAGWWHWCQFFPLCKRYLSSRNPDTAHRDQNVAFFSGFLQGCCMGFDSIMQIA